MLKLGFYLNVVGAAAFVGLFVWGLSMRLFDWWWLLFAALAGWNAHATKKKMKKEPIQAAETTRGK